MKKIGFIGAGKIAQALARGFIKSGITKTTSIRASCDPADLLSKKAFMELGGTIVEDNVELVRESDVIILAIKPTVVEKVVKEVKPVATKDQLFMSVAMGIPIANIEKILGTGFRVVRAMPNTPVSVGAGASVFCMGNAAQKEDEQYVKKMFESVGTCEELPEYLLDSVTGLSGSGPAYVYMVIESMADGGVKMGLPRDLSLRLATQTVFGASKTLLNTRVHPAVLREEVTSPSGTTAAGLYCLETHKIRFAFVEAIEQATKRAKQINEEIMKAIS